MAIHRRGDRGGFTLVEIMIVVAIIALLAAIAVPNFLRARKRSQAVSVLTDLRLIDSAVGQYALESGKVRGDTVSVAAWQQYIKSSARLYTTGADVLNGTYGSQTVDQLPTVDPSTWASLLDVTGPSFWSPYTTR